jgi:hypothetical protein
MTQVKKWYGDETECDVCKTSYDDIPWFADAVCLFMGRRTWMLVCPTCHAKYTSGKFGTGVGQKYDAKTRIKLEG